LKSVKVRCQPLVFLDGHNNPGFSGGPVVFHDAINDRFRIISVISGYLKKSLMPLKDNPPTEYNLSFNSGIIITTGIEHAFSLIHSIPEGFILK
jgi:hypothetical protein